MDAETQNELRNRDLPKWPQMKVTGARVTVDQAKEIIRRTDMFFSQMGGGNAREANARIKRLLGMPLDAQDLDYAGERPEVVAAQQALQDAPGGLRGMVEAGRAWDQAWGQIDLQYVNNDWIAGAFVFGPHGWCQPTGYIGYEDNVGKWPSVQDIEDDWRKLAEAFPFLDLQITLFDGESGEEETVAVVGMRVKDGKVWLTEPEPHPYEPMRREGDSQTRDQQFTSFVFDRWPSTFKRECGIPLEWIWEWHQHAIKLGLFRGPHEAELMKQAEADYRFLQRTWRGEL